MQKYANYMQKYANYMHDVCNLFAYITLGQGKSGLSLASGHFQKVMLKIFNIQYFQYFDQYLRHFAVLFDIAM